jgi:hypothetical protein
VSIVIMAQQLQTSKGKAIWGSVRRIERMQLSHPFLRAGSKAYRFAGGQFHRLSVRSAVFSGGCFGGGTGVCRCL